MKLLQALGSASLGRAAACGLFIALTGLTGLSRFATAQPVGPIGDLIVDGTTVTLSGTHRFGVVRVVNGGNILVDEYRGRPAGGGEPGGRLEIVADRIEVGVGARISANGAGFRGREIGKGEGPGGGEGGITSIALSEARSPLHPTSSGAGGGYGGRGGDGAELNVRGVWKGGEPYGSDSEIMLGSAGGAAPASHHEAESLVGGDGGGALVLRADTVTIAGEVSADGDAGQSGEYDAGGGGSGGGIRIETIKLVLEGTIAARGGRGGRASVLGGAGGGGRIRLTWADGEVDPAKLVARAGRGPCPGPDETSFRGCEGSVELDYEGPLVVYLPLLPRNICIGPNRKAIALVLDSSSSMRQITRAGRPAIEASVEAAAAFLGRLTNEDRVALVSFDSSARTLRSLTADLELLRSDLAGLKTSSGSRLDSGLYEGSRALAGSRANARRILIMLTDGRPSQVETDAVRRAAGELRAAGVRIYTIGIGAEVDAALLAEITADASRVFVESDAEDLDALYRAIAEREDCPLE